MVQKINKKLQFKINKELHIEALLRKHRHYPGKKYHNGIKGKKTHDNGTKGQNEHIPSKKIDFEKFQGEAALRKDYREHDKKQLYNRQ